MFNTGYESRQQAEIVDVPLQLTRQGAVTIAMTGAQRGRQGLAFDIQRSPDAATVGQIEAQVGA